MFSLKFRHRLTGPIKDELDQLVTALRDFLLVSHDQDGNLDATGINLSDLNASNLSTGTVPLARLSNISDAQISASAAIAWPKVSKSGSSLADLTTRSAGDLSSGTLAAARLPSITKMVLSANTVATVAAAATTFLGTNGENATETIVRMVMPVAGVLRNLYVVAAAVAGAAQSFTYTVRVNGADTTITCAVSGAVATTANDTTHTATVAAGDTVDFKLVTSAGAAAVRHALGLELATS